MKKIIVASTNPVKINAVKRGFSKMFPKMQLVVKGISVASNVSDQPMSEEEILKGAENRANNAYKVLPNADYWVGIEGGVEEIKKKLWAFAWVVVKSKTSFGEGKSASFLLPPKLAKLVKQGKELGEADDIVFGMTNSKQKNGAVGILTKNVLTRTTYYEQAVILALIPFINKLLYPQNK